MMKDIGPAASLPSNVQSPPVPTLYKFHSNAIQPAFNMTGWTLTLTRFAWLCAMASAQIYAGPSLLWSSHGLPRFSLKSIQNQYEALEGIDQATVVDLARQDAADVDVPLVIFRVDELMQHALATCGEDDFVRRSVLTAFTSVVYPYTFVEIKEDAGFVGNDAENGDGDGNGRVWIDRTDLDLPVEDWSRARAWKSGSVKEMVVDLGGAFSAESSMLIESVCKEMQERSAGFVAVLVGKGSGWKAGEGKVKEAAARMLEGEDLEIPIRSNPAMLSSLLLTLFLLFFLTVILLCVDCVQVPTLFAEKYPAKGKVFT